jgi:hypothetical protein
MSADLLFLSVPLVQLVLAYMKMGRVRDPLHLPVLAAVGL